MNETRYYKVAGHLFSVTVDGCLLDGTAAGNLDGNAAEPQGEVVVDSDLDETPLKIAVTRC